MNTLPSESSLLIHSLGWTLLHSLWQGALIAVCLWTVLRVINNNTLARIKYHLYLSSLLVLVSWFAVTWIQQWQRLRALTVVVTEASVDAGIRKTYTIQAIPQQPDSAAWLHRLLPHMDQAMPWLVGIYIAGVCFMILRFGIGLKKLIHIRYRGITAPDQLLTGFMNSLKDQLGITGPVKLLLSSYINMPVMLGAIKPVILLPMAAVANLTPPELEAILLHELAHIKRQDYLVNMLQIFIETVLFFNPFMWWISAGIRREREHCCDDLVISQTCEPLPYAKALAALEASRYASQPFTLAAGGQKHHLFHRIKRITEMKKTPLSYGRLAAALLASGALICSIVWFSPAFAQSRKDDKTAAKQTRVQRIIVVDANGQRKEYDLTNLPASEKARLKSVLSEDEEDNDQRTNTNISRYSHSESYSSSDAGDNEDIPAPPEPPAPPAAPSAAHMPPVPPAPPAPIADIVSDAMAAVDWSKLDETTRQAMREARRAMRQIDMNNANLTEEERKALAEARRTLKEIDWEKINREVRKANKDAARAMEEIDWDKINREVRNASKEASRALKEVDWDKINREVREARMEAERNAREARLEALKHQREAVIEQRAADREARLEAARHQREAVIEQRAAARETILANRRANDPVAKGIKALEKDGLIDKETGYAVAKKNGKLYINGKEQSDEVYARYEQYFRNRKIAITGNANSQSVSITD